MQKAGRCGGNGDNGKAYEWRLVRLKLPFLWQNFATKVTVKVFCRPHQQLDKISLAQIFCSR